MPANRAGVPRDFRAAALCGALSALCFFVGGIITVSISLAEYNERRDNPTGGMEEYKKLNTTTLIARWTMRRRLEGARIGSESFMAVGWATSLPAVNCISTLSGERSAALLLSNTFTIVVIITIVNLTFQAGLSQLTDWVATWPMMTNPKSTTDGDIRGIQALEIAYLVTTSRTLWLFALDELLLAIGWVTAAFLVYTGTDRIGKPLSKLWGHFSVVGAIIAFIGLGLNISRYVDFVTFVMPTAIVALTLYIFVLPIWMLSLSWQLRNRSDPYGTYRPSEIDMARMENAEVSVSSAGSGAQMSSAHRMDSCGGDGATRRAGMD